MTNVTPLHDGHANPDVTAVADEVRGLLAKRRIPAYKIGDLLADGTSRSYWQRRVAGDIPLDVADLSNLAGLLGVSIADLIPRTPVRPRPAGSQEVQTENTTGYIAAPVVSLAERRAARA